jgi:DNA-binding MarR family transcriptional regulator
MRMTSDIVVDSLNWIVFGGVAMTAAALEQATAGQEITFTQWRAILFVGESATGCRVGQVAQRLMGTLSATSRLLRRLEDRGLLTLERDERDRRATRARLTDEGRRIRQAVLAWRRQKIADITSDVVVPPEVEHTLVALAARFEAHGRESGTRRRTPPYPMDTPA